MSSPKFYCGYVRVSTDKQKFEGSSLDTQKEAIKRHCMANDINLLLPIFEEQVSGTTDPETRIQMKKLLATGCAGLICCKQDRLGRATSTQVFLEKYEAKGFHIILLDSLGIDTKTGIGAFMRTIKGAAATLEVAQLHERLNEVIQQKKRNGELIGTCPFGKRVIEKDGKKYLIPDADEMETIEIAKKLSKTLFYTRKKEKPMSLRQIASELTAMGRKNNRGGVSWCPGSVASLLKK